MRLQHKKLANRDPYWFTSAGIEKIEKMRNAKYMGYWCGRDNQGNWAEQPLDVFYDPEPDTKKGHGHYFGLVVQHDKVLITNAESCFSESMVGVMEDGEIYVSRYRHDFVQTPGGKIIDGGRDYVKTNVEPAGCITVTVEGDEFIFEQKADLDETEDEDDDNIEL